MIIYLSLEPIPRKQPAGLGRNGMIVNNMDSKDTNLYLEILSDQISQTYRISKVDAAARVDNSPIRRLLAKDAEWVVHVPIGEWAKMVYKYSKQK